MHADGADDKFDADNSAVSGGDDDVVVVVVLSYRIKLFVQHH
jgi:hypothetical protein